MRIITQEELDAVEVERSFERWAFFNRCDACKSLLTSIFACSPHCVRANGVDWVWHGFVGEMPTPETVHVERHDASNAISCPSCSTVWSPFKGQFEYVAAVHARAVTLARAVTGDFDEEAERSRLQMVPA